MSTHQKKTIPAYLALKPRRCKYCRAVFTPARPQDRDAKFCEPNHRKAYHRYGGLPFDKLMDRVRRETKQYGEVSIASALADMDRRIAALETWARDISAAFSRFDSTATP